MSDTEDDILFRIGFESHPQAGAKLEALAQAVEMTQKRIDQMFTTTADRVQRAVTAMTAVTGKGGSGGQDSGEAAMRTQLKATADAFQQQTDRLIALQTDMVVKLDAIRAKDVASADAHAKRLEAIYANTLANLNAAVAGSQAGATRATVAVGGGGLNVGGGNTTPTAGTTGATQLEAMEAARKATQNRIIADTAEFNEQLELAAGHEILTLEQRNEGAQLFGRARAVIMKAEAEMARQQLETERENSIYAITQLKEDLQLLEDIQNGVDVSAMGVTPEQAAQAGDRVSKYYETIKAGQERVAADERKLAEQQIKESQKVQAEQDKANRARRKLIENTRRQEEQAAKQAETERKKEEAEIDRLARWRRGVIERSKKYEQQLTKETGEIALEAYEKEADKAARALGDVARGRQSLMTAFEQTAGGIGKLSRSAVLLGLAQGEDMEKVIRQLAMVQAGIDLVAGGVSVIRGVSNAFEGLRMVIAGRIAAQRASVAADALAVQGSVAVQNALNVEALSAQKAAAAHMMLNRARSGGQAVQMPITAQPAGATVPGAPGSPAGGGAARSVGMAGATVAGAIGGGVAGGAIGAAGFGEQGRMIGSVMGTVAGGIIGPMVAAAIMRSNLMSGVGGRVGGLAGRVGGGLMAGAGRLAPAIGLGGVGGTGAIATAIGGTGAALGASALAALGGAIFALKSTVETFKDASRSGIGGGSQQGSFNDTVGGSSLNPFSFFIAWNERAELAQAEERTKRMEHASVLLRIEQEHLRNLQAIRIDFATKSEAIDRETQDAIFQDRFSALQTPTERADALAGRSDQMRAERDRAAQTLMGMTESDNAGGMRLSNPEDPAAVKAMDDYIRANERLIETEKQREQVLRQVAAESRKATLDQIKGIEDTIRARQKESEQIESMMMTARARFGQMSKLEQERAKQAFERVKAAGGANADRRDIDRIRGIGTDETNKFVQEFDQAQGTAAGFDETFGADGTRRQRAIEQANQTSAEELGQIAGQDPNKILENAKNPAQIELVNRESLAVTLNAMDEATFKLIMDEIESIRRDNAATLQSRVKQASEAAQAEAAEKFRADAEARGTGP